LTGGAVSTWSVCRVDHGGARRDGGHEPAKLEEAPMRNVWRLAWLSVVLGLGLTVSTAAPVAALGGTCGTAVACECGDELESDRVLTDTDPIANPPACTGDGLTIATPGVSLDLGLQTITGVGVGTGVLITAGTHGVTVVGRGRVLKFGTGIGASDTNNSVFEDLTLERNAVAGLNVVGNGNELNGVLAQFNTDGILVEGSTNLVTDSIAKSNGRGFVVTGFNDVNRNQALLNTGDGLTVTGSGHIVARNSVKRNGGVGVVVGGSGAFVDRNQSVSNGGDGFSIAGNGHTVDRNTAKLNGGDGFSVADGGSAFDRNQTKSNRGFGILDESGGGNTYTRKNVCKGDLLGDSSPEGLCS
jgi:hypothetical protein